MKLFTFILSIFSFVALAAPQAEIITLRGSATYEGKPLVLKQVISGNGILRVEDKSYVKIRMKEGGNTVALAANKADNKRVAKNQWGGIGGRFGSKCQEILTLTPELMAKVGGILPAE